MRLPTLQLVPPPGIGERDLQRAPAVGTIPPMLTGTECQRADIALPQESSVDLRLTSLAFEARLASADHGLRFLGPSLRGAFGYVLKSTVCQMPHRQCGRCVLRGVCPYPAVFEGRPPEPAKHFKSLSATPQPFVLDIAPPGSWDGEPDALRWMIRFMGSAGAWAPYVVETFRRIGAGGLGRRRTPFELLAVTDAVSGRPVWRAGQDAVQPWSQHAALQGPQPADGDVRWRFITPVHLRGDGHAIAAPSGLDIVLAGRRRWRLLNTFFGDVAPGHDPVAETFEPRVEPDQFKTVSSSLRPWSITRYSGRQQARLILCGLTGEIVVRGPWSRAGAWMRAARLVQLGKYTTFGLGRVEWEQVA